MDSEEAIHRIATIVSRGGNHEAEISTIVDEWRKDDEPIPRPEGSIMWEIEVPVTSFRTYHVPGTSEGDALNFFHSYAENDKYDMFADPEDELDGEETSQAKVLGPSSPYTDYFNPISKEWE